MTQLPTTCQRLLFFNFSPLLVQLRELGPRKLSTTHGTRFDMREYAYFAEAVTEEGVSHRVDLEETGWNKAEFLSHSKEWNLVPYDPNSPWPIVKVHLPVSALPIFKSRVFAWTGGDVRLRVYGIGYSIDGVETWIWSIPGAIEVGEETELAALLFDRIKRSN
jgi:hypothetical protein